MNIIGKSECTAAQMAAYLIARNPNAKPWALEYAQLYLEEGEAEGVRGDGAWIQSCKETGNYKYEGGTAVTFDQNNFCGLGVTRKGLKGHSFETPRLGIRAQMQHLKGYATTAPLKNPCIDPRYKYVQKGCAPTFELLAGKWAVPGYDTSKASSLQDAMNKGIGYGFDIIKGIETMKKLSTTITEDEEKSTNGGNNMNQYTNSPLVSYTKISPNSTNPRNHVIDTITIHCFVGQVTVQRGCEVFNAARKASCNYVVAKDGQIGLVVDEANRSWCSSNSANDHRAITIEVASDTTAPYAVTDAAFNSLVKLCADICKRNNIKKLVWSDNKAYRVGHINGCNMTVHRDYAAKSCPGQYLYERHGLIAEKVNKLLSVNTENVPVQTPNISTNTSATVISFPKTPFVVEVLIDDLNYRTTPSNSGVVRGQTGKGKFTITQVNNGWGKLKSGVGWIYLGNSKYCKLQNSSTSTVTQSSSEKNELDGLNLNLVFNDTYYSNKYPDLKKAFGTNATALKNHYIVHGAKEGRQAIASFNPVAYKNRYTDLQKAFGDNLEKYVRHYIEFGHKEGRVAL